MSENEVEIIKSPLEVAEENLKTALVAWDKETTSYVIPKAMQRKRNVAVEKIKVSMYDIHEHVENSRPIGRPATGVTKTSVRNEIKNATPEQLAKIAAILLETQETDISEISPDVENPTETNEIETLKEMN
jgi:hypothetical protein